MRYIEQQIGFEGLIQQRPVGEQRIDSDRPPQSRHLLRRRVLPLHRNGDHYIRRLHGKLLVSVSGVEMGTKEGSIISTLGISASIFVNITILTVGVLVGTEVIQALPAGIRAALLNYLAPALFGGFLFNFS